MGRQWNSGLPRQHHPDQRREALEPGLAYGECGFCGAKKLLEVLTGFQARFAALPEEIDRHSGAPAAEEYVFLEFDCWEEAFDYGQSSFILDEASKVIACASLRIHAPKTHGLDIFFLLNVDCFEPVVSRRLADALARAGISGFKRVPSGVRLVRIACGGRLIRPPVSSRARFHPAIACCLSAWS